MNISGKVVVITGGGSGIGRATAVAFAREGATVHLVDRLAERAEETAEHIRTQGGEATPHVVDLTVAADVEALAERIYRAEGRVDVLHNNAGVGHGAPIEQVSLQDWKWVIDTNLWTVIHGIHAFVPRMLKQGGGGHIINTASGAGLFGLPEMAPYCASKFAVVGLSESLNIELGSKGIHVTAICPGVVKTRIVEDGRIHSSGRLEKATVERLYERYGAEPEDVARAVLHAVRNGTAIELTPLHVRLPWLMKRVSVGLYQQLSRVARKRFVENQG